MKFDKLVESILKNKNIILSKNYNPGDVPSDPDDPDVYSLFLYSGRTIILPYEVWRKYKEGDVYEE